MGEPWTAVYCLRTPRSLKRRVSDQQSRQRERPMQDMLAQLEKLRSDAAECQLIRDLATDPKKRELFDRLAAHLTVLASEVERVMLESGKKR